MSKFRFIGIVAVVLSGIAPANIAEAAQTAELPPIRCEPGDKIDGSSAAQAREKMNAAGYSRVRELNKGCDNAWHGVAVKDGVPTHVSLSPGGLVQSEGD